MFARRCNDGWSGCPASFKIRIRIRTVPKAAAALTDIYFYTSLHTPRPDGQKSQSVLASRCGTDKSWAASSVQCTGSRRLQVHWHVPCWAKVGGIDGALFAKHSSRGDVDRSIDESRQSKPLFRPVSQYRAAAYHRVDRSLWFSASSIIQVDDIEIQGSGIQ